MKPAADVAASCVQNTPAGSSSPVHKMFRVIEAGLGYQYVSVWNLVLMVINQFFEVSSTVLFVCTIFPMQILIRFFESLAFFTSISCTKAFEQEIMNSGGHVI